MDLCGGAIRGEPAVDRTSRVAAWAYGQADLVGATVWERGRDGLVGLDPRWRVVLGA